MQKTTYFCDICGEEIKVKHPFTIDSIASIKLKWTNQASTEVVPENMDHVCNDCLNAVKRSINDLKKENGSN